MRIYTRGGDRGETGLPGGRRVGKDHPVIEAVGSLDELNCALGLAAAVWPGDPSYLRKVQVRLFDIGAQVAAEPDPSQTVENGWSERAVEELEAWIDQLETKLEPLRHFILPGGSEAAARLHFARAIARRTERCLVRLHAVQPVPAGILTYLNRLSDLLFVAAREANRLLGAADVPYKASE